MHEILQSLDGRVFYIPCSSEIVIKLKDGPSEPVRLELQDGQLVLTEVSDA